LGPAAGRPHANAVSGPQAHLSRPRTGGGSVPSRNGELGQQQAPGEGLGNGSNQDSITLGQLKAHTAAMKSKEKVRGPSLIANEH